MNPLEIFVAVFFLGVVGVSGGWLILGRRRQWLTVSFLLLAATLGVLLLVGVTHVRPTRSAIVLERLPAKDDLDDIRHLVEQLRSTGTTQIALIVVDPTAEPRPQLSWSEANPDLAEQLLADAASQRSISDAMETALEQLVPTGWWEKVCAVVWGASGRVVVGITDEERWKSFQPVEVDHLVDLARRREIVVNRVELKRRPITPTVDIRAPLGLLADWELERYPLGLLVSVRAPRLTDFSGQKVNVTVSGQLDETLVLPPHQFEEVVLTTGEVVFRLPITRFKAPAGTTFPVGFVNCELEVALEVGGMELKGKGTAFLRVRKSRALIVAGAGSDSARLLVPRILDEEAPVADDVQRLRGRGKVLEFDRARTAARFDYCTPDAFRQMLQKKDLPFFVVLHEMPTSFWDRDLLQQLDESVRQGMHLMVIDPPPLPSDAVAANRLAKLLPAVAAADPRRTTPTPQTADRTPILNLIFDTATWGEIGETPDTTATLNGKDTRKQLPKAVTVQFQAARALIATMKQQGMLFGDLSEHPTPPRIRYKADKKRDRAKVRIGPDINAKEPLTRRFFGSGMELRIAVLFAPDFKGVLGGPGQDRTGLALLPAGKDYPLGDPSFTPNQVVVLFAGNVPQPTNESLSAEVKYEVVGTATTTSKATAVPRGWLGRLLLRGVNLAVIRLDLPSYEKGFEEMIEGDFLPDSSKNPFATFKANPRLVLDGLEKNPLGKLLPGSGSWLTKEQAAARLLRKSPADPFFDSINLEGADPETKARTVGEELARRVKHLFVAPSASMALAATEHGPFLDERITPALTIKEWGNVGRAGGLPESKWPANQRRTGPRRFRQLALTTAFPREARANYLAGVDTSPLPTRLPPWPLGVGGRLGQGSVLCLGYSPFETAERWWTAAKERICNDQASEADELAGNADADHFGLQRLIDPPTFLSRLRPVPRDRPLVREIRQVDIRGGIELTVDFRPDHANHPEFWKPELVDRASNRRWELLLHHVDWSARVATFHLRPEILELGETEKGVEVAVNINGNVDPQSRFYLRTPAKGKWVFLDSLESVASVAAFSGGTVGTTDDLGAHRRPARVPLLLGLTGVLILMVLLRSRWRLRLWHRAWFAKDASSRPTIDAQGVAEEGHNLASPRSGLRGMLEERRPIGPGDRLEDLRSRAPLQLLLGIGLPDMDICRLTRSTRLDLVVHLGASMRVCRDRRGTKLQVRFAGLVAQLIAELYWANGAMVQLIGTGVADGPLAHGLFGSGCGNQLLRLVEEMAQRPPAPEVHPEQLARDPGATVVWISDFLNGPPTGDLLSWGASLADEDGRFGGIHLHIPEEDELIGFGFVGPSFTLLDRSNLTPADLRKATQRRVDQLRLDFARAGLPFAALSSEMTGQLLVETLKESGLLGRGH